MPQPKHPPYIEEGVKFFSSQEEGVKFLQQLERLSDIKKEDNVLANNK